MEARVALKVAKLMAKVEARMAGMEAGGACHPPPTTTHHITFNLERMYFLHTYLLLTYY